MWVVKLGGSMLNYPGLNKWLEVLSNTPVPTVIVPGGGPLADAVRYAQKQWQFTDSVAHHIATQAMGQNALFFARLNAGLEPCADRQSIQRSLAAGKVPVWQPTEMVSSDRDVVQDWTMTSDSLAAWLASRLEAEGLLLVKSCAVNSELTTADMLSHKGIVDQSFPRIVTDVDYPVLITQREKYHQLDSILAGNSVDAVRL